MEIDSHYSGEIKTGDLIVVAVSHSWLDVGFFLGRGGENSVQYYLMNGLSNKMIDYRDKGIFKPPKKAYYNTDYPMKITKYSKDCLSQEQLVIYENAIEALKLLKIKL
jgi:hypothetical protein